MSRMCGGGCLRQGAFVSSPRRVETPGPTTGLSSPRGAGWAFSSNSTTLSSPTGCLHLWGPFQRAQILPPPSLFSAAIIQVRRSLRPPACVTSGSPTCSYSTSEAEVCLDVCVEIRQHSVACEGQLHALPAPNHGLPTFYVKYDSGCAFKGVSG